ncbi:MAG: dihydrodipicolinate reductase [Hyphomicrobiales bacterium]|nr:hemerythrin domain-containing protein [Hyphomicrobiales bacterium]PCJ95984.1 MAG: dihydrodipicolinate reductase [Hyphomicrobiales bacterium]
MKDIRLDKRKGLPEALRVLLEEYPRENWENNRGFNGLIKFWLERHMMFRQLLDSMVNDTQAVLDKKMEQERYAARFTRYGGMFVGELHGHHNIEDHHYFPILKTYDPRLERGFEILDKDHHVLDHNLDRFTKDANAMLQLIAGKKNARNKIGAMEPRLVELNKFLDRHLVDEEEIIVPVILKYGAGGLS